MERVDSRGRGAADALAGGGEMGALMRSIDWSTTPLGPVESWSLSLRMMVSFLLANRFPLLLWWGPEFCQLYNDPYRPVLGTKHPRSMGQPASACWSEIWHIIGPLIETPFNGGPATWMDDIALEINRYGFVEETHFTIAYSPVPDETAPRGIGGVLATVHEITDKIVGERRVAALRDLGARTGEARTAEEACAIAAEMLANHTRDVPFALLYLLDPNGKRARLAGATGIGTGEDASPPLVELDDEVERGRGWPLAAAIRGEAMITVEGLAERFASVPPGPWTDPPHTAVIVPVRSNKAHQLAGLLVAGVSPRLRLDDQYRSFFELAAAQVATAVATAQAYEEERRRAEALAEIDRAKTAFFSNVSHEFRTPLTLMLGPLEEALGDAETLPPARHDGLVVAHRNSLRLLKLVNSLLDFSRIEAGRVQASYEPTDLAVLTAELASNFRSACEKAGLTLEIDCPPVGEPVHVDHDMWEKIVLNLLSNAFKFTFEGGIAVALRRDGEGRVTLAVKDTGTGIPAHELPRLFDRFHRVEGVRGRTHEGTGIGLALVQELVRLHGGAVRAESVEGRGSTFTVSIPLGTAHLPPDRVRAGRTLASTAVGATPYVEEALRWLPGERDGDAAETAGFERDLLPLASPRPDERASILVADDNADMREYVRRLLAGGYDVRAVADGEAALEALRECRPDLLLSDVMMPRLDGFGLLRAVRADPALADLPVVLLSARAGEEASVEGLEAGADDYLVKPFGARELLARVGANLEMARLRSHRRQAEEELRASESFTRSVLESSPDCITVLDLDGRLTFINSGGLDLLEIDEFGHVQGRMWAEGWPAEMRPLAAQAVAEARSGRPSRFQGFCPTAKGTPKWWDVVIGPVLDAAGRPERLVGISRDITEQQGAEAALAEETRMLETLNRTGAAVAAELDLERLVQAVTDAGVALSGAEFGAFFYNVISEAGEAYTLYTLSGAPREAFAKFPMPRNTAVFGPTFRGEGIVRSDDITKDPRYGRNAPRRGMPEGHLPVRSYLAVPVISRSGEVLGGLFFGHSQTGIFAERAERLMTGLAGQAAIAIDNARLYQDAQREIARRQQAEAALRDWNDTLEQRVAERTRALEAEMQERQRAEAALQQAQKMEAVGQLTGGVAHDFNNLLTGVLGSLELLDARLEDERLRKLVQAATRSAQRGARLTAQLLAFSRKQHLAPTPLDLGAAIGGMTDMLQRTLGGSVEVRTTLAADLWPVLVDATQLEVALLNLAINARDAMPLGGTVLLAARNVASDEGDTPADVAPGDYVAISVVDTGEGMSEEVLARAFEPFYTTKEVGKGTGLGLSQVYGLARQSGGTARILSRPGEGTTIEIYLPRAAGGPKAAAKSADDAARAQGRRRGTVLVVDDRDEVRDVAVAQLESLGYRAVPTTDGRLALDLLVGSSRIDILLIDHAMPGLSGLDVIRAAREKRPDLPAVLMTGYADASALGERLHGVVLLRKPFRMQELAAALEAAPLQPSHAGSGNVISLDRR